MSAEPFTGTYGYDYRAEFIRPYVTVYDASNGHPVELHIRYDAAYAKYGDESWPWPVPEQEWAGDRRLAVSGIPLALSQGKGYVYVKTKFNEGGRHAESEHCSVHRAARFHRAGIR